MSYVEVKLKVGRKGEVYTTKKLREVSGITPGSTVIVRAEPGKIVIEKIPSIEDAIKDYTVKLTVEQAEKISEEIQREAGIWIESQ